MAVNGGVKNWASGEVVNAADLNEYVADQVIARFETIAARTAAYGIANAPSLQKGLFSWVESTEKLYYYDGSAWDEVGAQVEDGEITAVKLSSDAVTTAKILDSNVTTAKIADSAVTSAKIADGAIVNADVNASAAIAYSKLSLSGAIVNADVNASAAIAYSKLSLSGSIVNADVNASAAIDKTKISGTAVTVADTGTVTSTMIADGTIVNADINASAAIDLGKLADATISIKTANYPLVLADKNKFIKMNSSSNRTITVPLQATVNFPEGSQIHIIRYGSGTLEIVGESNAVNIYATPGKFLRAQYSSATLLKCADTNVWMLMGDLSAS